jgi:hypothetical protein
MVSKLNPDELETVALFMSRDKQPGSPAYIERYESEREALERIAELEERGFWGKLEWEEERWVLTYWDGPAEWSKSI